MINVLNYNFPENEKAVNMIKKGLLSKKEKNIVLHDHSRFMYIGYLYENDGITQEDLAKEFLISSNRKNPVPYNLTVE